MQALAALQLALVLLPKIEVGITEFVAWISALRSAVKQAGEWTPEYEAKFRQALVDAKLSPEEIPD